MASQVDDVAAYQTFWKRDLGRIFIKEYNAITWFTLLALSTWHPVLLHVDDYGACGAKTAT